MSRTGAYRGQPGYVDDEASIAHSQWMVDTGLSGTHYDILMQIIQWRGAEGLTCKELTEHPYAPLGLRNSRSASATLTNAYADGSIARLKHEKRFNNGVYVHPDFVNGRDTKRYRPARSRVWTEEELEFCGQVVQMLGDRADTAPYAPRLLLGIAKKILAETGH